MAVRRMILLPHSLSFYQSEGKKKKNNQISNANQIQPQQSSSPFFSFLFIQKKMDNDEK